MITTTLASETNNHIPNTKPGRVISWYRTPLPKEALRELHERSDFLGALQTFGYLGTLLLTGGLTVWSAGRWPWWSTVLLFFGHGTCSAFTINAVHELGHGTVFKTRWLNGFFESLFAFLGWINHKAFDVSHVRHHQYTLHQPDDLEVVLPYKVLLKQFLRTGFVNPLAPFRAIRDTFKRACGRFEGVWSNHLFPESDPEKRRPPIQWARFLLAGHGLILITSITTAILGQPRWLMVPLVTSFWRLTGDWLLMLCNNTQHIGLMDSVADFRLCCRTITLNPVLQFLYWHMNYHIEHHMYAAVPCYRLGKLHRLIRHDLPPTHRGLFSTWRKIAEIQERQETDPAYQFEQPCPNPVRRPQTAPASL